MSRLGRWSYVCTCGFTTRRRGRAALHLTVARDGKAHRIQGIT